MLRSSVTGNVEDSNELDRAPGEMMASPVTPTYGLGFLSSESGSHQPPQYITPETLNCADLGPVVFDYFPSTTSIQPHGSGPTGSGLSTLPEPDWSEASYFSEATSTAPFSAAEPFSGYESAYDFMSPVALMGDHGFFSPTSSGRGTASSELGTSSCLSPPMATYNGKADETSGSSSDYTRIKLPETKRSRGPTQVPKRRVSPSFSGVDRSAGPILEVAGETALDSRSGNKIQLRTAYRKAKTKRRASHSSAGSGKKSGAEEEEEQEDPLTPEERRARHSHNVVEKQYRNRLNAQFVRLLSVLPADQRNKSSGDDGSDNPAPEDKRVSKAEVLDLATRRIRALEEERIRLEEENSKLVGVMG